MIKNAALNRFLILFLLSSFILLTLAFAAAFFSGGGMSNAGDAGTHDSGNSASINLAFRSCSDYLDAESISPRFCASRLVSLKKTSDGRQQAVSVLLPGSVDDTHYRSFRLEIPSGQTSPAIICEFMHSKDGML